MRKKGDEYRKRLQEEFEAVERPVLSDLRKTGIKLPSLGEVHLFGRYLPLSIEAVKVLSHWLPNVHYRLQEPIVRLLAVPAQPYDGAFLAKLFDDTLKLDLDQEELDKGRALLDLRWAIANTIAEARPLGLDNWVASKIEDPLLGQSKEMLFLAAARLCPREQALRLLWNSFDDFPVHCALGISEVGQVGDLETLQTKKSSYSGMVGKEIGRGIRQMRKRLKDHGQL